MCARYEAPYTYSHTNYPSSSRSPWMLNCRGMGVFVWQVIKLHKPKNAPATTTEGAEQESTDALAEQQQLSMADSFRLAMRARRKST
eukprot:COSAG05_NODE_22988_length_261_cov_0.623457_1_plen_86_part_11